MNQGTKRSILRWIHLVLAIPIAGYVYSPFEDIPQYAPPTRYVFLPLLVLTGLWMWQGHVVRRLFWKGSPSASTER
jgi:thiosulfate reductase cytochrome b subunit